MTTPTGARTVAQDEAVQKVQATLHDVSETQDRLRARRHALHLRLAYQMDNGVVVPPELRPLSVSDAAREIGEIDRELAALERRVDALQAELMKADVQAQATILESELPEYRRLVAACDQAEAARQQFLVELRRRGVFATPPIAKED